MSKLSHLTGDIVHSSLFLFAYCTLHTAFYANPQTGERKWTIPPGSLVLPRSADGEWYELWSDEHNLPYYYHTVQNETTWYKPDGFVIPLKAVQVSDTIAGWVWGFGQ